VLLHSEKKKEKERDHSKKAFSRGSGKGGEKKKKNLLTAGGKERSPLASRAQGKGGKKNKNYPPIGTKEKRKRFFFSGPAGLCVGESRGKKRGKEWKHVRKGGETEFRSLKKRNSHAELIKEGRKNGVETPVGKKGNLYYEKDSLLAEEGGGSEKGGGETLCSLTDGLFPAGKRGVGLIRWKPERAARKKSGTSIKRKKKRKIRRVKGEGGGKALSICESLCLCG